MKRLLSQFLVLALTGNVFLSYQIDPVYAEEGINKVNALSIGGTGNVSLTFSNKSENVAVKTFSIEKPPRIVIDVANSELAADPKIVQGSSDSIIKQVRSAQHKMQPEKIVRVVIDLKQLVKFKTENSDNKLIISLIQNETNNTKEQKKEESSVQANVDEYTEDIAEKDSDSSASSLNDNTPKTQKTDEKISILNNLSTQPVTLDFNQADLNDVFRILSAKSGVNIILGDDVEGDLTIHLEQVPFNEAFKTILSLKSLVAQQVGTNILRIITPEALTTQRSKSVTFWRIFPLNYADVNDAKKQIDSIRSAEGRRGVIEIDSRTNSLIVSDSPEGLDDVARLISEIDKKPQQVLIESRFVEVSLDNQFDLGIRWGYYSRKVSGNKVTTIGSAVTEPDATGADTLVVNPGETGVEATIPGQIGGFTFGMSDGDSVLLAHLQALAREGKAKFLSNPKITTLNNNEASIWVGTQIPVRTTTISETINTVGVVYKQVGIELKVTPTINVDNRITLKVRPEVSLPDTANISPAGDLPINTRYAETTVLIENNQTLVIGGFIEEQNTQGINKVPLLGDIPILGQFFRSNQNSKTRRELLVFITPKILED